MTACAEPLFEIEGGEPADSYVYVIGTKGSHVVKIGTSIQVAKRLRGIQTSSPDPLAILWRTPGDRELEHYLHAKFHAYRRSGEWFDFGELDPVSTVSIEVETYTGVCGQELSAEPQQEDSLDRGAPPPDDPDRLKPEYQPDENGCRIMTPGELRTSGLTSGTQAIICAYTRCGGSH